MRLLRWRRPSGEADAPVAHLSRHPVFDRAQAVTGYELVSYSKGPVRLAPAAPEPEGEADAEALALADAALFQFGLEHLVGSGTAYMTVTPRFVVDGHYRLLPRRRVVLQLPGTRPATDELREAVEMAEAEGYAVALDDFDPARGPWSLVPHVSIVKLDPVAVEHHRLPETAETLRSPRTKLLAMRVEAREVFDECRHLGFDLFEGFFFQRPEVVRTQRLAPDRLAATQLLAELHDPDAGVDDLAAIIRRDVGLTYRVLTVVNSAAYAVTQRVENVEQAVVLLGIETLRNFASLIALAGVKDKPQELVTSAMVRARMCEDLAEETGSAPPRTAFLVGLLSVLDALMDTPLDELLARLPLAPDAEAALRTKAGPLGALLDVVERYERGDLSQQMGEVAPLPRLTASYLAATRWADELRHSFAAQASGTL